MAHLAMYYPWIYLRGGIERTIVELARHSRHRWTILTNHYDREGTFPELTELGVQELERVSVKRSYGEVARAARILLLQRLDLARYDGLLVHSEGLGDLVTFRNHERPVLCFCHTPLKVLHDPHARARYHARNGLLARPKLAIAGSLFHTVDRLAWRHYAAVMANSQEVRRRIARAGLYPEERIDVLHPGVDLTRFVASPPRPGYFLLPGRIMWSKNLELAVEAFRAVRMSHPDCRLVLAGYVDAKSQEYRDELMRRGAEVGGVELVEAPTDAQLAELYANAAGVLFTAPNEDWGIVPLEGMASGKPVIAVDQGGPRESVRHGETGLRVAPTPEAFAAAMQELLGDPERARRMGEAGARVAAGYTWQVFAAGLDARVDTTLGAR